MTQTYAVVHPDGQRQSVSGERIIIAAAALLLGEGRLAVEDHAGAVVLPVIPATEKLTWFRGAFSTDLNSILRERRPDVADALRSFATPEARFLAMVLGKADPRGASHV